MEGGRQLAQSPTGASLFGLSGARLRWLGITLLAVGFLLFIVGAVLPFLAIGGFAQNPWGPDGTGFGGFSSFASSVAMSFVLSAIGLVLMAIGGFTLRFGLVRPVASYLAVEASPAIQTEAAALASGLRAAGFGATHAAGSRPDVRVKCRNCGYLDTEDAEFCSKCGQRM